MTSADSKDALMAPAAPAPAPAAKTVVSLAFDIEAKGCAFENPVIQIGAAWGTNLKDIQSRSWCFDYRDRPMEKRCWDDFWSQNQATYERIVREGKAAGDPAAQWKSFARFLQDMYKYHSETSELELVSDNPAFDLTRIDQHLKEEKVKDAGVRYGPGNAYLSVVDPTEQIKGLGVVGAHRVRRAALELKPHTHWAPDDAENILVMRFLVRDAIRRRDEQVARVLANASAMDTSHELGS